MLMSYPANFLDKNFGVMFSKEQLRSFEKNGLAHKLFDSFIQNILTEAQLALLYAVYRDETVKLQKGCLEIIIAGETYERPSAMLRHIVSRMRTPSMFRALSEIVNLALEETSANIQIPDVQFHEKKIESDMEIYQQGYLRGYAARVKETAVSGQEKVHDTYEPVEAIAYQRIRILKLSSGLEKVLLDNSIRYVGELIAMSPEDIKELKNMTVLNLQELSEVLRKHHADTSFCDALL